MIQSPPSWWNRKVLHIGVKGGILAVLHAEKNNYIQIGSYLWITQDCFHHYNLSVKNSGWAERARDSCKQD